MTISNEKRQLVIDLNKILEGLSCPLSKEEINNGWTVDCQLAIKELFMDIKNKLELEQEIPPVFIAKWLDHWGVSRGILFEKAALISCQLRDL